MLIQLLQCFFELFIMSIMMINAYKPSKKDSFIVKHFYNTFIMVYQFQMFLSKFTLFFFVVRKIYIFALLQFSVGVVVFLMVYLCKFRFAVTFSRIL